MTIRVVYHHEVDCWWAESPDIDGWTVAGQTYGDVHRLVQDGVSFALASQVNDARGGFDELRFSSVVLEHHVAGASSPPSSPAA